MAVGSSDLFQSPTNRNFVKNTLPFICLKCFVLTDYINIHTV